MSQQTPERDDEELSHYAGRWVAHIGKRVIGQGGTPEQALQAARSARFKEVPQVSFVPSSTEYLFPGILSRVRPVLPAGIPVFLVGGAVRDALLQRITHDLDFIVQGDVFSAARQVANQLNAAYYPMDEQHETARVILNPPQEGITVLDFAALRGPDLESDLRARDFTINAVAVPVDRPQELHDPLGGMADLLAKKVRACSATSFLEDPVRILRAIRLASGLGMNIVPETRRLMRAATSKLPRVSAERLRDELFRILDGPQPSTSLLALDMIGALAYLLPELHETKDVTQSPPHTLDVWGHSLEAVKKLQAILGVLSDNYNPQSAASMPLAEVSLRLGRYREQLSQHLNVRLNPGRTLKSLLLFAAACHDIGKPQTRTVEESGRVRFFRHDEVGARILGKRARLLRLSNEEVERLEVILRNHLRPILLTNTGKPPSRQAIYRFFRSTGQAGVDICLLSLADKLATYGTALPADTWAAHVGTVRTLMEAWWEHKDDIVAPPRLVSGDELMSALNAAPGPQIGKVLEAIREAQATGKVNDREQALAYARMLWENWIKS